MQKGFTVLNTIDPFFIIGCIQTLTTLFNLHFPPPTTSRHTFFPIPIEKLIFINKKQ